ncbi:MAG: metallophosphoesterase [Endomicrobiia bacterium]
MNKIVYLLFFVVAILIYYGMNYYVYKRIVNGLMLDIKRRALVRFLIIILATTFFLGEFLDRTAPVYFITLIGSVWVGILTISIAVFVLKDIVWYFYKEEKILTVASLSIICILSIIYLYQVYSGFVVKEIRLTVDKPKFNLPEISIVQISDVHFGTLVSKKWLEKIVDKVNSLQADIIVITGDLIDGNIFDKKENIEKLKTLTAKKGVYVVTGNHEFYFGIDKFTKIVNELGFNLLRNENINLENGITIAGVDEITAQRFVKNGGPDLTKTFKDVDNKNLIVLLSHQPDLFDEARVYGVDLQLSGHTHMGQIPPMDLIVKFYFKYPYGLVKKNGSYIYTTSGTGFWGPPMRLFSKCEIVKFVITKEQK